MELNYTDLLKKLSKIINNIEATSIDYSDIKYDDTALANSVSTEAAAIKDKVDDAKQNLVNQANQIITLIQNIKPGSNYYMEYTIHWSNQISSYKAKGSYGTAVHAMSRESVGYYGEQSCSFPGGSVLGLYKDSDNIRTDEVKLYVDKTTFETNYPNAQTPTSRAAADANSGGVSTLDNVNIIHFKFSNLNFSYYSSSTPQWIIDINPSNTRVGRPSGYDTYYNSNDAPWHNTGFYAYLVFTDSNDNIKRVRVGSHQGKWWYNSGWSNAFQWVANDGNSLYEREMVVAVDSSWQFVGFAIM